MNRFRSRASATSSSRAGSPPAPRRRFLDRPLPAWLVLGGLLAIGCTVPQRSISIVNRSNETVRVMIDNVRYDGIVVSLAAGGVLHLIKKGDIPNEVSIGVNAPGTKFTDEVDFYDEGGRSAYLWIDLVDSQPRFVKKIFTNDWPRDTEWMLTEPIPDPLMPRRDPVQSPVPPGDSVPALSPSAPAGETGRAPAP